MTDHEFPIGNEPDDEPLDLAFGEEGAVLPGTEEDADGPEPDAPGPLLAAATAWADIVLMLAACAAAVAGIRLLALPLSGAVLPWTLGLGLLAWLTVSAILLAVRRSWPGALMLGLVLPPEAGGGRVLVRLTLIVLAAATAGLAAAALSRFDPWSDLVPERTL